MPRLARPPGGQGWGATGREITASLTRSPKGTWGAVTWAIGRYAKDAQLSWAALPT